MKNLIPLLLVLLLLGGCGRDDRREPAPAAPAPKTCRDCHPFKLDPAHDLGCVTCHGGNQPATGREAAHQGMTATPAHPNRMRKNCGPCHPALVKAAGSSLHFSLKKEVNAVRRAFGARQSLASLRDIPRPPSAPATILALADDLLRRRCLNCHVYNQGGVYPETVHGTGCAACHLDYRDGELQSHAFVRQPGDAQCLHCHYGNYVGADYYGRYEHDFSWEFRTPFRTDDRYPRPYGLEFHQLAPDIHRTKGISCIDCHAGSALMGTGQGHAPRPVSCEGCHLWRPGRPLILPGLSVAGRDLVLTTRRNNRAIPVPRPRHPAHLRYGGKVACVVCHAQWTYNDQGTHLLRTDIEEYEPWAALTVQGSYEVESRLEAGLYGDQDESGPVGMLDKLTGVEVPGLWLKGYELRRWEAPLIGRDADGILKIFRPVLDLHLSFVNAAGTVVFDSVGVRDERHGLRPYTPHTIGKAGAFFRQRLRANLAEYPLLEDHELLRNEPPEKR